jgi:hypothetical protein
MSDNEYVFTAPKEGTFTLRCEDTSVTYTLTEECKNCAKMAFDLLMFKKENEELKYKNKVLQSIVDDYVRKGL